MQNLIKNDQWYSQDKTSILYFTNTGPITYDPFCLNNFRFCSLSMTSGNASNSYDQLIPLEQARILRFGYHMRAILVTKVTLEVVFVNQDNQSMVSCRKEITKDIDADFHDVCGCFQIPQFAYAAKVSLRFEDATTACTFGMPFAEIYK